jgi:hypothetical protein
MGVVWGAWFVHGVLIPPSLWQCIAFSLRQVAARLAAYPTLGPQPISAARTQSSYAFAIGLNVGEISSILASPHGYLITLSARASTFGAIVRPICSPFLD